MKEKSLKKNALLNVVKTLLTLCFPLITFPYSSRILGPEGIGKVNFSNSIISYFAIIASLGISTYATREVAKVRDNKTELNKTVKEIFTINIISTIISYLLLIISLIFFKNLNSYRNIIIICSTLIMFTTIGMGWLYQALEDYFYITIRSIVFQIISVILLFTLVKDKDDYLQYAAVNIISNVGANICNFFHSRKYISFRNVHGLNLKKHLKPIFILFASAVTGTIFSNLDSSMIGFLSTDKEVGLYAASLKLIHMIKNLFPAIIIVIFPRISYYIANKSQNEIIELSQKTINLLLCLSIPISVGLYLLLEPIILLFCGPKYLEAINITKIMCPFIVFSTISNFLGSNIMIAYGKEKIHLYSVSIMVFINIILNAILIPKYKASGAAFATLITEIFLMFFNIIYLKDFVKKLNIKWSTIQYIYSTAIMTFVIFLIKKLMTNSTLQMIFLPIIGIFSYSTMLLLTKNKFLIQLLSILRNKFINKNS